MSSMMSVILADPIPVAGSAHRRGCQSNVKLMFQSPLPINNKRVFLMVCDITQKVRKVKQQLHQQEQFETTPDQLTFYIDGVELSDELPLSAYNSITHRAIIGVRGACHEFYVLTANTNFPIPVRWHGHMTVTEMLRRVFAKTGVHLDLCRFTFDGKEIPVKGCYKYTKYEVGMSETLLSLGLASGLNDPCNIKFRRFKNGNVVHFSLDCFGKTTIAEIHQFVGEMYSKQKALSEAALYDDPELSTLPKDVTKAVVPDTQYDDEDKSVAPYGDKVVYLYTSNMPQYSQAGLNDNEPYLSYHPPEALPPQFIDFEMDYSIPHLSDLGIRPGEGQLPIILEFYSLMDRRWTSEVTFPEGTDTIAVKTIRGNQVQLSVTMDEPVSTIIERLWCSTGDEPQLMQLQKEGGVVLPEWKSLRQLQIFSESVLHCTRQSSNNAKFTSTA